MLSCSGEPAEILYQGNFTALSHEDYQRQQQLSLKNDTTVVYADYEIYWPWAPYNRFTKTIEWLIQKIKNREFTFDYKTKFAVLISKSSEVSGKESNDALSIDLIINFYRIDSLSKSGRSIDKQAFRWVHDGSIEGDPNYFYKPFDKVWRMFPGWPCALHLKLLQKDSTAAAIVIKIPSSWYSDWLVLRVKMSKELADKILIPVAEDDARYGSIPRLIHQTWDFQTDDKTALSLLPVVLQRTAQTFKTLNPSFYHRLINDSQMRQDIIDLEGSDSLTLRAFDMLRAKAFRADLWRYVILWHRGGVYSDIKLTLLKPLDLLLSSGKDGLERPISALLVKDIRGAGLYNGFMAIKSHHPLMRIAIDLSVEKILNKTYPRKAQSILSITGPRLLEEAFYKLCMAKTNEKGLTLDQCSQTLSVVLAHFDNTGISIRLRPTDRHYFLLVHNGEYRRLFSRPDLPTHYEQMYRQQCLYSTDPPCKQPIQDEYNNYGWYVPPWGMWVVWTVTVGLLVFCFVQCWLEHCRMIRKRENGHQEKMEAKIKAE